MQARALAAAFFIAVVPAAGDTVRNVERAPPACHLALEALTAPRCITEHAAPARGS